MVRHAAAVAVAMCLVPATLFAQSTTFTVVTASANVHKGPSTGSAVVGTAPHGAVLQVTRELGSWVKVSWPRAQDGAGYVNVSWGTIAHRATPGSKRPAGTASAPASEPRSAAATAAPASSPRAVEQPRVMRPVYVTPASHRLGLGGRMGGSPLGFGATARSWRADRLGVQLDVSRYALTASGTPARVTAIQIEPSLLYSLPDSVTDYMWVRPYIGAGAALRRHSLSSGTPGAGDSVSANGLGLQTFGGGEMTFASVPQFAISVDLSYHWFRTPVPAFDLGGMGVGVSGHWYLK
jgi:opacity protein-like surface antigen